MGEGGKWAGKRMTDGGGEMANRWEMEVWEEKKEEKEEEEEEEEEGGR